MSKIIQTGLVLLVLVVPLIFSHATTEVYGLIKWTALEMGVLALLVLWLIGVINTSFRDSPLRGQPLLKIGLPGWAVLSFFCIAIISLVKATNIHEGVKFIYQLGAGAGLFFLIVNNVKDKKGVNQIVFALVLAGVVSCLFSLYENRGIKFHTLRFAYTSTFGNPIFFSQYLSLVIPISIAMCCSSFRDSPLRGQSLFSRLFFGLAALLMLGFLVLTRSRGAYLGLALALLYCYVVLSLGRVRKIRNVFIGALAVCLIVAVLVMIFLPQAKGLISENIKLRNLTRVYLLVSSFEMIKDNPILGVGAGNFKVVYPLYRSPEEREVTPRGVTYSKAHNDFLQIWAETGTLGIICFLWILFSLGTVGSPRIDNRQLQEKQAPSAHISLGLSASMITLLFQAIFNPVLYVPASAMGFWVLLGLLAIRR